MAQICPFVASTRHWRSRDCGGRSTRTSPIRSSKLPPARLVHKLQRLVLERPDVVREIEGLLDRLLASRQDDPP